MPSYMTSSKCQIDRDSQGKHLYIRINVQTKKILFVCPIEKVPPNHFHRLGGTFSVFPNILFCISMMRQWVSNFYVKVYKKESSPERIFSPLNKISFQTRFFLPCIYIFVPVVYPLLINYRQCFDFKGGETMQT